MTTEKRVDRDRRGMWISAVAILVPYVVEFLGNVVANYVHPTGSWFRHDWVLVLSAAVSALPSRSWTALLTAWTTLPAPAWVGDGSAEA